MPFPSGPRPSRSPRRLRAAILAASALVVAGAAEAARPSEDETIARIERELGQPLTAAASDDVARAVADAIQALTPQELQYSIDIVGAVAEMVDPQTAEAVAEAARTAVADAAAAHPEVVEGWWAKLIDDSIAMVVTADPAAGAPDDADVAAAEAAADAAPDRATPGALAELSLSFERPDIVDAGPDSPSTIADEPLPGTDLALAVERLTARDETVAAADPEPPAAEEQTAEAAPRAMPAESGLDQPTPDATSDGSDATLAMAPPVPPEPPDAAAAEDVGGAERDGGSAEAAADEAVPAADPENEPTGEAVPAADPESEPTVAAATMRRPPPAEAETESVRIVGPAPDVPVAIEAKLGSFDGIVELVEFWLQKPIEEATTLELARAVQATVLMLPPDRLGAASAVAGAVAAVVPGPQAVQAVTRAAEAGVQVKASREPGRYTTAQVDDVLTSIGRATGNIGAIQPAAGPFGAAAPTPAATPDDDFADQVVDFGS